tara:strand:+ start:4773 stop:4892 length:120 start_codon:yes stop_codon:yes gene_type:complete
MELTELAKRIGGRQEFNFVSSYNSNISFGIFEDLSVPNT